MLNRKYFVIIVICLIFNGLTVKSAFSEVCISDSDAVDLITLLDASERDLEVLGSCESLVKELYTKVEEQDKKVVKLTEELIEAKQDVIKYKDSAKRWKRIAWYSSITGALIVIIQILPSVL